jgi:hypothetical protein
LSAATIPVITARSSAHHRGHAIPWRPVDIDVSVDEGMHDFLISAFDRCQQRRPGHVITRI